MARRRQKGNPVHGILLLDKPLGYSSNKALQTVKKLFNAQKAGHTGSLDPLATGMLPLCFGEATKVSAFLLDSDKQYLTNACLGKKTTTGDKEGEVINERPVPYFSIAQIEGIISKFKGEISQIPPMYSALKKDGQPLYKLARKGIEVERKSRQVMIHLSEVLNYEQPVLSLRVRCSKGTYIRTLVEDIGEALGCGATVVMLRREFVEPFEDQKLWTLEELNLLAEEGNHALCKVLMPPDFALQSFSEIHIDSKQQEYFLAGRAIQAQMDLPVDVLIRTYDSDGKFLGLAEYSRLNELRAKRVFNM